MAFFSIVDLAGSDAQSNFAFTCPYLDQSHIHVYIDAVETFAFSFNSAFVIHLTTPLSGAHTVRIQRLTPYTTQNVVFTNGSVLGDSDLNTSDLQILFAMQELSDLTGNSLTLNGLFQYDALGHRIINVGTPVDAADAVRKQDLDAAVIAAPGSHSIGAHTDSVTTSLAKGDILIVKDQGAGVLKYDKIAIGTNGQVLVPDATQASGMGWVTFAEVTTVGGTPDAITLTPVPAIAAYVEGQAFWFLATGPNTVAATVAVSGLAAKSITKAGAIALAAGDIPTGSLVGIRYDGTRFQLLTPSGLNLLPSATLGTPVSGALGTAITAVTQALDDSTTKLATTAFVQQEELDAATAKYPRIPVRQAALSGSVDVNGQANFLVAGTGLAVDYNATTTPVVLAHANGFDGTGEVDVVTKLVANATNQFGTLPANITSYLQADKLTATTITGGNTRIPPQYGEVYDQTQAALMHFNGTNGAVVTTDDYGNTWTFSGNAQLSTAQKQFGSASLLLDGTGDYIECVPTNPFKFAQQGAGWTIECWVRFNVLPISTTHMVLVNAAQNATQYGILLRLFNNAGTTKLELDLSSNGTSTDIANGVVGTNTTWAINTWYHIAIVFDALAGKYFVYKDGAQDISVTSSVPVAQVIRMRIGRDNAATFTDFNGWIDEFRVSPCVRYPNGTTFTPAVAEFAVEGHFFSTPEMKMYEVTGASASAGTNPTMTNRPTRLFLGEADAGAATISAVRTYAYRGKYVSGDTTFPAVGTRTAFNTYLGFLPRVVDAFMRCYTAEATYTPGQVTIITGNEAGAFMARRPIIESRNVLSMVTGPAAVATVTNRTTGVALSVTPASWKFFITAERGW